MGATRKFKHPDTQFCVSPPDLHCSRSLVEAIREKAMTEVRQVSTVSLAADMWMSINMGAYLAVTCHYITENSKLATVLLGVQKHPLSHRAARLAGKSQ